MRVLEGDAVGVPRGAGNRHQGRAPGQAEFGTPRAVAPKSGAFQSRPSLVVAPGGAVWVAYNELDESGKAVVVTRLTSGGQP